MKKWRVFTTMIVLFFAVACEKPLVSDELSPDNVAALNGDSQLRKGEKTFISDGDIELGEKLNNPYSVENMKEALSVLKKNDDRFKDVKVEHNYDYVKLVSESGEALSKLEELKGIDLYAYPLDYEVEKSGNSYKDKSVAAEFPIYWAAIPVGFDLPKGIKVEKLEKLFLPFGSKVIDEQTLKTAKGELLQVLEETSENLLSDNRKAKVSSFVPSGYIKVHDDVVQSLLPSPYWSFTYLPIKGVKIKVKRWFTTRETVTDINGNFQFSHSFNGPVDYTVVWERPDFNIRVGSYGQANSNVNNVYGPLNANFNEFNTPNSYEWAHVYRGAYTYYYDNSWGINIPPLSGSLNWPFNNATLAIGVRNNGQSHFFGSNLVAGSSQIIIAIDGKNSREIFGNTIHEIAHTSHWELGFTDFDWLAGGNKKKLAESWATGVEWKITNDVYQGLVAPFANYTIWNGPNEYQNYTLAQIPSNPYTPLFIDLIDNENQLITRGPNLPNDTASGFNLQQLESRFYLPNMVDNWTNYRNSLITNFAWVTPTASMEYLFDNYDE